MGTVTPSQRYLCPLGSEGLLTTQNNFQKERKEFMRRNILTKEEYREYLKVKEIWAERIEKRKTFFRNYHSMLVDLSLAGKDVDPDQPMSPKEMVGYKCCQCMAPDAVLSCPDETCVLFKAMSDPEFY